jgi:hypothetical protein
MHLFRLLVLRVPDGFSASSPFGLQVFPSKTSMYRVIRAELLGKRLQEAKLNKFGGAMDLPWWQSMKAFLCTFSDPPRPGTVDHLLYPVVV